MQFDVFVFTVYVHFFSIPKKRNIQILWFQLSLLVIRIIFYISFGQLKTTAFQQKHHATALKEKYQGKLTLNTLQ